MLPFAFLLVIGAIDVVADVNGTTIIQTGTPDHMLGRVFGAFESVLVCAMLVGALVVGPLIGLFGPRAATVAFAVVSLAILLVCLPRLRTLEDVLGVRMFVRKVPVLAGLPHAVLEGLSSRMSLETRARWATGSTSSRRARPRCWRVAGRYVAGLSSA